MNKGDAPKRPDSAPSSRERPGTGVHREWISHSHDEVLKPSTLVAFLPLQLSSLGAPGPAIPLFSCLGQKVVPASDISKGLFYLKNAEHVNSVLADALCVSDGRILHTVIDLSSTEPTEIDFNGDGILMGVGDIAKSEPQSAAAAAAATGGAAETAAAAKGGAGVGRKRDTKSQFFSMLKSSFLQADDSKEEPTPPASANGSIRMHPVINALCRVRKIEQMIIKCLNDNISALSTSDSLLRTYILQTATDRCSSGDTVMNNSNIIALTGIFATAFVNRERKLINSVSLHDNLVGDSHMKGFCSLFLRDLLDKDKKAACIENFTKQAAAQSTADIKDAIQVMKMMGATYNDFCWKIKGLDLTKVVTDEVEADHAKRHPHDSKSGGKKIDTTFGVLKHLDACSLYLWDILVERLEWLRSHVETLFSYILLSNGKPVSRHVDKFMKFATRVCLSPLFQHSLQSYVDPNDVNEMDTVEAKKNIKAYYKYTMDSGLSTIQTFFEGISIQNYKDITNNDKRLVEESLNKLVYVQQGMYWSIKNSIDLNGFIYSNNEIALENSISAAFDMASELTKRNAQKRNVYSNYMYCGGNSASAFARRCIIENHMDIESIVMAAARMIVAFRDLDPQFHNMYLIPFDPRTAAEAAGTLPMYYKKALIARNHPVLSYTGAKTTTAEEVTGLNPSRRQYTLETSAASFNYTSLLTPRAGMSARTFKIKNDIILKSVKNSKTTDRQVPVRPQTAPPKINKANTTATQATPRNNNGNVAVGNKQPAVAGMKMSKKQPKPVTRAMHGKGKK